MTVLLTRRGLDYTRYPLAFITITALSALVLQQSDAVGASHARGSKRARLHTARKQSVTKNLKPLAVVKPEVVSRDSLAKVALIRAQQLQNAGVDVLVESQLREAVRLAPDSVVAQRTLAQFLSSHEKWPEAASQWREVLRLTRGVAELSEEETEANLEFARAKEQLSDYWKAPDVVTLGADTQNPTASSPGMGYIQSSAMLHPGRSQNPDLQEQTQVALPLSPTKQSSFSRAAFRAMRQRSYTSAAFEAHQQGVRTATLKLLSRAGGDADGESLSLRQAHQMHRVQAIRAFSTSHAQILRTTTTRLVSRQGARVALERARQLGAYDVPALEEQQLRQAVAMAPDWSEAQIAIARYHSEHEQWEDAAKEWQNVLSTPTGEASREAHLELHQARQMMASRQLEQDWSNHPMVTLGADSRNISTLTEVPVEAVAANGNANNGMVPMFAQNNPAMGATVATPDILGANAATDNQVVIATPVADSANTAATAPSEAATDGKAAQKTANTTVMSAAMMRPSTVEAVLGTNRIGAFATSHRQWIFTVTIPGGVEAAKAAKMHIDDVSALPGGASRVQLSENPPLFER